MHYLRSIYTPCHCELLGSGCVCTKKFGVPGQLSLARHVKFAWAKVCLEASCSVFVRSNIAFRLRVCVCRFRVGLLAREVGHCGLHNQTLRQVRPIAFPLNRSFLMEPRVALSVLCTCTLVYTTQYILQLLLKYVYTLPCVLLPVVLSRKLPGLVCFVHLL